MEKNKWIMRTILLCALSGAVCFAAAYFTAVKHMEKKPESETIAVSADKQKITPSTKMVYEYYYTGDGVTKREEDEPPYFLIGLTLDDMVRAYADWSILSFSGSEVVMRRTIEGKSEEHYIIGISEGYVAVFYSEEIDGIKLKELTEVPVSSLPAEDRKRLSEGIRITGEEALYKALEDYCS